MADYANDVLVSTDWAAENTDNPDVRLVEVDEEIRAYRDWINEKVVGKPAFGLVDVRSPEEFRGELLAPAHLPQEQSQKPGHIPGAANIPWGKNVNAETGQFLPAAELKK